MIKLKMRCMPGDIPIGAKIALLEGRHPNKRLCKAFRRDVRHNERAVLKERCQKEVQEALCCKS